MNRSIITTGDGSRTLRIDGWNEPYHSIYGAVQETRHVFIDQGLAQIPGEEIHILEMGFGTGLNTLMTMIEAGKRRCRIYYTAVEAFPVIREEWEQLHFDRALREDPHQAWFELMHEAPWEESVAIGRHFHLTKRKMDFRDVSFQQLFDLIYYDAFGPRVQPELWTGDLFLKMYRALRNGGILTTYCAKGSVRRALQHAGFITERLTGPPGKREMLRATKKIPGR